MAEMILTADLQMLREEDEAVERAEHLKLTVQALGVKL